MANTLSERIDAKIASLTAEIGRVKANADIEVERIKGTRTLLQQAKGELTPDREALLALLKQEGLV